MKYIVTLLLIFLLCSFLIPNKVFASTISETRYLRKNLVTVNGLYAYYLNTTQNSGVNFVSNYSYSNSGKVATWAIRVFNRTSDGTEKEITNGVPVAQVYRSTTGSGLQNNTWNCPFNVLTSTMSIVVKWYVGKTLTPSTWVLLAKSTTEQLGANYLNSSKWNVFYYTTCSIGIGKSPKPLKSDFDVSPFIVYDYGLFWNTATYNTRIENFKYFIGVPSTTFTFIDISKSTESFSIFNYLLYSFTDTSKSLEIFNLYKYLYYTFIDTSKSTENFSITNYLYYLFTDISKSLESFFFGRIVDSYYNYPSTVQMGIFSDYEKTSGRSAVGQTFTVSDYNYKINRASFYYRTDAYSGNPNATLYAVLYNITGISGTNGKPTGTRLAISNPIICYKTDGIMIRLNFDFPINQQYQMNKDTDYCIAIEAHNSTLLDTTNYILIFGNGASQAIDDGNSFMRINTVYYAYPQYDTWFYVYGYIPITIPEIPSIPFLMILLIIIALTILLLIGIFKEKK
jgi:hypothetical protein